jgi:hypothetical protein
MNVKTRRAIVVSLVLVVGTVILVSKARAEDDVRVVHGLGNQSFIFKRDTSYPELGEAWMDPSGMIWGDAIRETDDSNRLVKATLYDDAGENGFYHKYYPDVAAGVKDLVTRGLAITIQNVTGSLSVLNNPGAVQYCQNVGASLPTKTDFMRLRFYMGYSKKNPKGYKPQVLPFLFYNDDSENPKTIRYWSSTTGDYGDWYLDGLKGELSSIPSDEYVFPAAVRCVKRRPGR